VTTRFDTISLSPHDVRYPQSLRLYFADRTPASVMARGNLDFLHEQQHRPLVALFCSIKCSETVIRQTYELAHVLCDAGISVIGGFHSPLEKECLGILLQGTQPVLVCPARSIERLRLPASWRMALEKERLLLLSPFEEEQKRPTSARALVRNQFIAALADVVLITHATPGGKSESFCYELYTEGKPLFALDTVENTNLFNLGAEPLRPEQIRGGESLLRKLGSQ
jgi:predicted Rossmann fold nucleotide-binding protein DprA/Smf involved in DNA uptake